MPAIKAENERQPADHLPPTFPIVTPYRHYVISAPQHKSEFNIDLLLKIKFLGSHAVVLVKTFPFMHQLLM